jgi:hypothetical protein
MSITYVREEILWGDLRTVTNPVALEIIEKNKEKNYLHEILFSTDLPKKIELGDAIENNPYHFFFYMVARFYYFDNGSSDIFFYYPNKRGDYFSEAALKALPPRFKRETEKYEGYEYIEMPGCLWYTESIEESWIYSYVRDLYKELWKGTPVEKGKYSYISRALGSKKTRRILNEEDLYTPLKQLGVSAYTLETMTFEQQVRLFASSEIITGPHGAGFAHLIFCKPGTIVCEINNGLVEKKGHYRDISIKCGLHHYQYKNAPPAGGLEDMLINVDEYKEVLRYLTSIV